MHRLAFATLLVSSLAHADVELSGGAGAGIATDTRFGAREVARLAIGARLDPHVTLSLPLEVSRWSYDPGFRRTSDYSLTLVPEIAIGGAITPAMRVLAIAGFGVGGVGDDNSCINLSDCDAYNHVVGPKLVGRAGVELRYQQLWLRPVSVEQTWGGVDSLYVSALAGLAF